jgi:isocitrate dehydrogenase kinase/phosphatase
MNARLDAPQAFEIARAMLDGFNRHYQLFRAESARAKHRFETADWHGQQRAQRERIEFYDLRVKECVRRLEKEFKAGDQPMEVWQQVKLHYIGLLVNHHQPELAETFFNSVTTKILHRTYFHNSFIFVRPVLSTEYIENDEPAAQPTYRAYYPKRETLAETVERVLTNFRLLKPWRHCTRDAQQVADVMATKVLQLSGAKLRPNFQIQVLTSLFFRNKGAYAIGKIINGFTEIPFALPILHDDVNVDQSRLIVDAVLFGEDDLARVFSFARAYFLVDMEIPSAFVQFLRSLMPRKPRAEIYNALGLAKQGKTLFYRDFLYHLKHSSDNFRIAPGIKGMVMLVFDLPSFPYVFKLIKDYYPPQKDTTRELIARKYLLVKQHDRVGRMADTQEYSQVAFPRDRFDDELIAEIQKFAPSQIEISDRDGDGQVEVILKHLYIERRMVPLNIYLQEAFDALDQGDAQAQAALDLAVTEYGQAIKDLVRANIFPGDMLWKNFGVTRHGKVVFYDYDEIEYLTDCNFRKVPAPRNEDDEMSGEVWYPVAKNDVFPETFAPFLLGNPRVREAFMRQHADLLEPEFWQTHQARIRQGYVHDVFPYEPERRLSQRG